tara:strand:+ start:209 stop:493 length:285 start_codon:yes stop_codon:yes gene_type:complete
MSQKITAYSLRIDLRSKELILGALSELHNKIEAAVAAGAQDEGTLRTYEELSQLRKGLALAPGEEIEIDEQGNPVEPTETPEDTYKSQEDRPLD